MEYRFVDDEYVSAMMNIVHQLQQLSITNTIDESTRKQQLWQAAVKQIKYWIEDAGVVKIDDIDMHQQNIAYSIAMSQRKAPK